MWLVSQPDGSIQEVKVDPNSIGHELLQKVSFLIIICKFYLIVKILKVIKYIIFF